MANFFNKIWSGLDWWDQEENQAQREAFAQQDKDEEERRKREAAVRQRMQGRIIGPPLSNTSSSGTSFDFSSPLTKVGSQSDYVTNASRENAARVNESVRANTASNVSGLEKLKKYGLSSLLVSARDLAVSIPRQIARSVPKVILAADKTRQDMREKVGLSRQVREIDPNQNKLARFIYGSEPIRPSGQEERDLAAQFTDNQTLQKAAEATGIVFDVADVLGMGTLAKTGFRRAVKSTTENVAEDAASATLKKVAREETDNIRPTVVNGAPAVEVSEGIKSTNLVKANAERQAQEALVRRTEQVGGRTRQATPEDLGIGNKGLDRPSYAHNEDIQGVIRRAENELNDFVARNPNAALQDVEAARNTIEKRLLNDIAGLQGSRYGTLNIPNVENPIALGKAGDVVTPPADTPPIANFNEAINGSLAKTEPSAPPIPVAQPTPTDIAESAATGKLRVSTDVNGNPNLISDAEAQRQLAEQGIVPNRGDSPVALEEAAREQAAKKVAGEQVDTFAPNTRERLVNRVEDQKLRQDLIDTAPTKERVVLADADARARAAINNYSDEELIRIYQNSQRMETPEDLFQALSAERRLQHIKTPEAEQALRNIIDATAEQSSKSGLWQRASQILFDDMSTPRKVEYLLDKLGKAGVDMSDTERANLVRLLESSDNAADSLRSLEDEAQALLDSGVINNRSMAPDVKARVRELVGRIDKARTEKELRAGEAWRFYQESLPKTAIGKRFADTGRTLMLSSPSGRIFDLISTSITSADDLLTRGVSNLVGKVLNKFKGPGTYSDTIISPRQLTKGTVEGAQMTGRSFRGGDYVEDFMGQARRASRGNIDTGGGPIRRTVRSAVELPTNLTRGLRDEQLFREGMQEAAQQGLKGQARRTYAELRASIPSREQLHTAVETHMRVNMLHDNKISRFLNNMAINLDKAGNGWGAAFIRNQVAPFTSWLGGNLHRALTDKNVLYNTGSIIKNAFKGNAQGVIDDVAKLAVNASEGYAAGMLLTKAGIITSQDANGDDYAGLYFHIGDRYIPVAIAGTASVPLIWGNAVESAMNAQENGDQPMEAFVNSLAANTIKNAGVASVFGGENNLQSTILQAQDGNAMDAFNRYLGNLTRQYIPGLFGDVNTLLDQNTDLNPTGEAPNTKVTYENPETGRDKTDVMATEINRTKARIPFLSQDLPRKEDTVARDFWDRTTRGNRESGEMVAKREQTQIEKDKEKDRKDRGVPSTFEGIDARVEDGNWDLAIEGYQWQLEKKQEAGELSKSRKKEIEGEIKRLELTRDNNYDPSIQKLYQDTSLTEWRNMGDPESEDYDPQTFALLTGYDELFANNGVSRFSSDPSKTRYYSKDSARAGGKKKKSKFNTSIAKQSLSRFQPTKAQSANFALPSSPIPQLEKVPNYDQSKLRKISVSKGGRG